MLPYLSEIERGRKEPSSDILAGICAPLDLTIAAPVTAISSVRGGEIALAVAA